MYLPHVVIGLIADFGLLALTFSSGWTAAAHAKIICIPPLDSPSRSAHFARDSQIWGTRFVIYFAAYMVVLLAYWQATTFFGAGEFFQRLFIIGDPLIGCLPLTAVLCLLVLWPLHELGMRLAWRSLLKEESPTKRRPDPKTGTSAASQQSDPTAGTFNSSRRPGSGSAPFAAAQPADPAADTQAHKISPEPPNRYNCKCALPKRDQRLINELILRVPPEFAQWPISPSRYYDIAEEKLRLIRQAAYRVEEIDAQYKQERGVLQQQEQLLAAAAAEGISATMQQLLRSHCQIVAAPKLQCIQAELAVELQQIHDDITQLKDQIVNIREDFSEIDRLLGTQLMHQLLWPISAEATSLRLQVSIRITDLRREISDFCFRFENSVVFSD